MRRRRHLAAAAAPPAENMVEAMGRAGPAPTALKRIRIPHAYTQSPHATHTHNTHTQHIKAALGRHHWMTVRKALELESVALSRASAVPRELKDLKEASQEGSQV